MCGENQVNYNTVKSSLFTMEIKYELETIDNKTMYKNTKTN